MNHQEKTAYTLIVNGKSLGTIEQLESTNSITEYTAELYYFVWRNSAPRFSDLYKAYESPSNQQVVQTWLQDKTESGFLAVIELFNYTKTV